MLTFVNVRNSLRLQFLLNFLKIILNTLYMYIVSNEYLDDYNVYLVLTLNVIDDF
jgi:hypothetical protein